LRDTPSQSVLLLGSLRIIIYDFLAGTPRQSGHVNEYIVRQLGENLAKLHLISESAKCNNELPMLSPFAMGLTEILPFLDQVKNTVFEEHPFVLDLQSRIENLRVLLSTGEYPRGMIHADMFPDNALFLDETDDLTGIIDFEEVCEGPYILDVGMAICGCCYTKENILSPPLLHSLLSSYESVRGFSSIEQASLSKFVQYACLSISFWRFRQFQYRYPNSSEADRNKYKEMESRVKLLDNSEISEIK